MVHDASISTSAEPAGSTNPSGESDIGAELIGHDLLSSLSHELRTPLTPVLASLSQLEQRRDLPEDVRNEIHTLRRNVELESRLIDDLLDLTRLRSGQIHLNYELIDPHLILHQALALCCEEIAARDIELEIQFGEAPAMVRADAARLNQIFWHLIRNACKFTPRGGRITVRTQVGDSRCFRMEVSDTGIGIPPQMLPRVFDAFSQQPAGRRGGGLGIGLAVSRALVELHQGTIVVFSAGSGQGSTFTVELPVVEAPALDQMAGDALHIDAVPPSGLRILLVEDHEDTLQILARLLRDAGHHVAVASSVGGALKLAEQADFDLLLSDIGLPDGTGLDIMRSLRGRAGLRGIALSGFGMEEDMCRSRNAGFEQHLVKPVSIQTLETAIQSVASH